MNDFDRDQQRERIDHNAATLLALAKWGGIPAVIAILAIGGLFVEQRAGADDIKTLKTDVRNLERALSEIEGDLKVIRSETTETGRFLREHFRRDSER